MAHSLQLLLLLALIVASAKLAGAASTRLGQPAVFGEILAGLLLGPTVLDLPGWRVFAPSASLLTLVRDLSDIGVILLMFVAGLETDLARMRRVGHVAFWAAAGGVALPFAGGALVARAFGLPLLWQGLFVGTILTATSVSISAQTLLELRALRSRAGSTILGAAVIDDVMGIVVLSVIVAFARPDGSPHLAAVALLIGRMAAFFALALAAGRALPAVARRASRLGVSQALPAAAVVVAFLYAWAAEYVGGVAAITGAYLAGLMFGRTSSKPGIDAGIHPLTYSMFVPVFLVGIGLQADGRTLGGRVLFTLAIVLVAVVAKVAGCGGVARALGFDRREALQVGVGMISRGEVGLIVASYGLARGIIAQDVFSAAIVMVLATTMVTPPLLKACFPHATPPRAGFVEETVAGPPREPALRDRR